MTKNNILIKHSAAVHIKSKLSFAERKIMNVMLKNAQKDFGKKTNHQISVLDLQKQIGWKFQNIRDVEIYLNNLVTFPVKWNILEKDKKNNWGVTTVLAAYEIIDGICKYEYSDSLIEKLVNPNIYANINLDLQKKYKGKYSLILSEVLSEHISTRGAYKNSNKIIKVDDLRDILGLEDEHYKSFKSLNAKVLKNAIKEINAIEPFKVKLKTIKKGRVINAVKFFLSEGSIQQKYNPDQCPLSELKEEFHLTDSFVDKFMRPLLLEEDGKQIIDDAVQSVREYIKAKQTTEVKGDNTIVKPAIINKAIKERWKPAAKIEINIDYLQNARKEWGISEVSEYKEEFLLFIEYLKKEIVGQDLYCLSVNIMDVRDGVVYIEAKSELVKSVLENRYNNELLEAAKKAFSLEKVNITVSKTL